MSISSQSGARRLKRYPSLEYYNVEKRKSRFTLGLDAEKNTHRIKKGSYKYCSELNFVQKSPRSHLSICPWSGAIGLERLTWLKYYDLVKRQITFTFGLNAAESNELH